MMNYKHGDKQTSDGQQILGRMFFGRRFRMFLVLTCLISSSLLTGCGSQRTKTAGPTHQVVDCIGREVQVPENPESVACLYAYAGHASVILGQEKKLTSVVAGLKRDHLMQEKIENIDSLPTPYSEGAINIEELLKSDPDLVLLRGEALVTEGERQKLEKAKIPYVVIDYSTIEEQKYSIQVLGEVYGCQDRAKEYLDYYEKTLDFVKERTAKISENERKTFYHSINEVVRTDVKGTISYEILELAGLRNVIDDGAELEAEGDKVFASVEQIYGWDPDLVLCNEPSSVSYFREDKKFEGLRAVREGSVYQLPIGISRWVHPGSIETPLAALFLGKTFYPEAFADVDLDGEVKSFYERFIGVDLTDEELINIYSGSGMREVKERKNDR